jgi:hypothetical protein
MRCSYSHCAEVRIDIAYFHTAEIGRGWEPNVLRDTGQNRDFQIVRRLLLDELRSLGVVEIVVIGLMRSPLSSVLLQRVQILVALLYPSVSDLSHLLEVLAV